MSQDLPIPRQDDPSDGPPSSSGVWRTGNARDRFGLPSPGWPGTDGSVVLAGLGAAARDGLAGGEWRVMTVLNGGPRGTSIRVPGGWPRWVASAPDTSSGCWC